MGHVPRTIRSPGRKRVNSSARQSQPLTLLSAGMDRLGTGASQAPGRMAVRLVRLETDTELRTSLN